MKVLTAKYWMLEFIILWQLFLLDFNYHFKTLRYRKRLWNKSWFYENPHICHYRLSEVLHLLHIWVMRAIYGGHPWDINIPERIRCLYVGRTPSAISFNFTYLYYLSLFHLFFIYICLHVLLIADVNSLCSAGFKTLTNLIYLWLSRYYLKPDIICSCEIKGNRANADYWTPVVYFYGINRIKCRWSSLNPQL